MKSKFNYKLFLNIFILLITFVFSLFIYTKNVSADSFYLRNGDINYCNLAMTTSVSYRDLPQNSIQSKLTYDGQLIKGASGNYPATHRFAPDLGTLAYPKPERYKGIADSVRVPPLTSIDLGYYTHNYSGHSINILDSWVFVSRPNVDEGDWTRLGAPGEQGSLSWNRGGVTESRSGKMVRIGMQGVRQNDPSGNYSNQLGKTVLSFKTLQPLVINSHNVTPEYDQNLNLKIKYEASITNQSRYTLPNIRVENILANNTTFVETHTFNPGETKNFTYYANIGSGYYRSIYIHPLKVVDPNEHTESLAGTEDKVAIARRDDTGAPGGWSATQPDFHLPLSITLIPYTIYSSEKTIQTISNISVTKTVSDSDENDVKNNTAKPNELLNYKIFVKNTGARSVNTILRDNYDQGKLKIVDSAGGNNNGDEVIWNLGTLENNDTRIINIRAQINPTFSQGTHVAPNNAILTNDANIEVSDGTATNIVATADLKITKSVSDNDEVLVKQNSIQGASLNEDERVVRYTIEVSNTGTSNANNVVITDDYDESELVIRDPGNGHDSDGKLVWNIGTLSPNTSFKVEFVGVIKLRSSNGRTIVNNVNVDSNETNPVTDSVSTKSLTPVLEIDKRVSDSDEVLVKENHIQGGHYKDEERTLKYDIKVSNSGNGYATNVKVVDDINELLKYGNLISISDNGVLDNSNKINWNIDRLNPGESKTFEISFVLNPKIEDLKLIKNYVIVLSNETPQISSEAQTLVHSPKLELSKDSDKSTPKPGEELKYNIRIVNSGSGNAYDVKVLDKLPDYLTVLEISHNGLYDKESKTITWENKTSPYIINGSYKPESNGWESNTTLTYKALLDTVLPVGENNLTNKASLIFEDREETEATKEISVEAYPINSIKKYILNETAAFKKRDHSGLSDNMFGEDANSQFDNERDVWAISGDIIKYNLVYKNTGNANSPETYIKDFLPKYILDEKGNNIQIIKREDILDLNDKVRVNEIGLGYEIIWDIGELKVGDGDQSISFRVKINTDISVTLSNENKQRLINNIAEIGSKDIRIKKESDNAVLQINQPNAVLKKGADKLEYQSYEEIVYSIEVENTGSSNARGAVKDTLPEGLIYKSSSWEQNKTKINGQNLEFSVELIPKQKVKIYITARFNKTIKDFKFINNDAYFEYFDENDNPREKVKDKVEVKVSAPNLKIVKSSNSNGDLLKVGSKLQYTIYYENIGSGILKNFSIIDKVPQNTVYVENSAKPSDKATVNGGETGQSQIEWKLGDLAPGNKGEVVFEVIIKDHVDETIKNTAHMKADNYEDVYSNEVIDVLSDIKGITDAQEKLKVNSRLTRTGNSLIVYELIFGITLLAVLVVGINYFKKNNLGR